MSIAEKALSVHSPAQNQPAEQTATLSSLPSEVLLRIFSFLGIRDLMAVSLQNKTLRTVVEDHSTSLGKVKRAFRVLNGQIRIELLPPPYIDYGFGKNAEGRWQFLLVKREQVRTVEIGINNPELQAHPFYYHVSETLFVTRFNNKWYSHRIDHTLMTIASSDLPVFPSITEDPDENIEVCLQTADCLVLRVKTATSMHFLSYEVAEKKGPESHYLGKVVHHIVCHFQIKGDNGNEYEEVTSIERLEENKVKWSLPQNLDRLTAELIEGKWLRLTSQSPNFHYHFLDMNSGKTNTYDPAFRYPFSKNIEQWTKNNICIHLVTSLDQWFGTPKTATALELETLKPIPLSHHTAQTLVNFTQMRRINCDFVSEKGFFKIEAHSSNHQKMEITFSGNPNVPLPAFSRLPPPLYVRIFVRIVNFIKAIFYAAGIAILFLLSSLVLIGFFSFLKDWLGSMLKSVKNSFSSQEN